MVVFPSAGEPIIARTQIRYCPSKMSDCPLVIFGDPVSSL